MKGQRNKLFLSFFLNFVDGILIMLPLILTYYMVAAMPEFNQHSLKRLDERSRAKAVSIMKELDENNIAYNLSDNSDTAIADTLNDENENFKITSDNKQTNHMIRYVVALAVFALGVFVINTYFIGI